MNSARNSSKSFFIALAAAIVLCTCYNCFQFLHCNACETGEDFGLFYNAARHITAADISAIYNTRPAQDWLSQSPGMITFHPFLYPPQSLFFLYPLGLFGPLPALLVWNFLPLLLLFLSLRTDYARQLLAYNSDERTVYRGVLAALFFPFIALNILAGQNGALWAALFILVLSWRSSRPVLAGFMLAVFSCKPQMGIMLPLLLLVERNWRVLLTAALGALCMIVLSLWLWGAALWADYHALMTLSWQIISLAPAKYMSTSANPYMALRMMGASAGAALWLQGLLSCTTVALVWRALIRCKEEPAIVVLLCAATFLVLPYAWIYDCVMLALPCALLFHRGWRGAASGGERIALVLLAFIPVIAIKLQPMHIPYSSASVMAAFLVALMWAKRHQVNP